MPPALTAFLLRFVDHPAVRRAAWLGFLSWVVALTLTGYLFGFTEGFFGRLFSATFVLWGLAAGTWFGIRPLVGWVTRRLSEGRSSPRGPRRTAPKRGAGRTTGPAPQIPASKWR